MDDIIDNNKYYLGKLCKRNHRFNNTDKTLRFKINRMCFECNKIMHTRDKNVTCTYCGTPFKTTEAELERNPNKFCNPRCIKKYYTKIKSEKVPKKHVSTTRAKARNTFLGDICGLNHDYNHTGKSLKNKRNGSCLECNRIRWAKYKTEDKYKQKLIEINCKNCNKLYKFSKNQMNRSKNNFCSHSCAASYNNVRKTMGCIRSKLELYIERILKREYPNLEILFNIREILGRLELDIYFPTLKFAVELNGPTHYEPIYGQDKLNYILFKDKEKQFKCIELGIEILIIDVRKFGKRKYYNIIKRKIDKLIKGVLPVQVSA